MVKKVINFKNIFIFILVMSMASLANAGSCLGGCSDDNDGGSSNGGACLGACSDGDGNGGGFSVSDTSAEYVCQTDYQPDPNEPNFNSNHVGKVIVKKIKKSSSSSCNGDVEFEIKMADDNGIVACEGSVIPEGFIIEKKDSVDGCGWPGQKNPMSTEIGYGYTIKRPEKKADLQTMCSRGHDKIPEGFVINEVTIEDNCKGFNDSGIAYKISYPSGALIDVCSGPKVPEGFGIKSVSANTPKCASNGSGHSGPGKEIGKAQPGDILCEGSLLPEDMRVSASSDSYDGCGYIVGIGSTSGPGFVVDILKADGSDICASHETPSGYVIISDVHNSHCKNNEGHFVKRADKLNNSENWICVDHAIPSKAAVPDGFIVTGKASSGHGCEELTYSIKRVDHAIGSTVCDGTDVPAGYGLYMCNESYYGCKAGPGSSSYGCKLKKIGSGDSFCEGNNPVPDDMVISKKEEVPSSMCSSKTLVTVTEPSPNPGAKTTACYPSTVPEGFVITRDKGITSCGDSGGVEITKPYTNRDTPICAGTNVPPGYGILPTNSNNTNTTYCKNGYWNVSQIKDDGRTYHLCYMQDIPQDYVTTGISEFCDGLGYVVAPPKSPMDVCRGSPIPDGYIVSAKYSATDGPCDLEKSMQIQHPNDYGRTNICADDDGNMHIPDKYEYTQVSNPSYCNGSTGGYINPTSVVPSNRILKEPDTTANSVRPKSISCSVGTPDAPAFLDKASGGC